MIDNSDNPLADDARTEKRPWQPPVLEVFDVATSTLFGAGAPAPADFATYTS